MKKIVLTSIVALAASTALMAGVNPAVCAGCHGQNFEKKALGRSDIVANMTHKEIASALIAYKTTTESDELVMKPQVSRYSDADLKAFAQTIGK
ncbi:MAG: cytochrome C [Epsilonproteobacteria bacterium]|nr:cytochrome C [Campylobacterota bacterium]